MYPSPFARSPSPKQDGEPTHEEVFLGDPKLPSTHLMYVINLQRLDPVKYSPKKFGDPPNQEPWEFDWVVSGLGKRFDTDPMNLLFRVFSQERKESGDLAPQVTRMLLNLWNMDYRRFKIDHLPLYQNEVDAYICYGGSPGGEQKMDLDWDFEKPPRQRKVNTIYIYDLASFTNPVEEAREVAHEYGHAVLPAVGGFQTPEDWGNGQLGEKIFLRWCRNEMAAGRLTPADVMGAGFKAIDAWVAKNVDPLVLKNAEDGPQFGLLEGQGQASMDAFTGLVCYADTIFQDDLVGLSLKLMASSSAKDYPAALVLACQQRQRVVVSAPALAKDKPFWIPLGNGQLKGATVVKKSGDWAQIKPGLTAISITYK